MRGDGSGGKLPLVCRPLEPSLYEDMTRGGTGGLRSAGEKGLSGLSVGGSGATEAREAATSPDASTAPGARGEGRVAKGVSGGSDSKGEWGFTAKSAASTAYRNNIQGSGHRIN